MSTWGLVVVALFWSVVLQAGKYSLITSVATNGVALRVKIDSPALDKVAPDLASYYKEVAIDQLARHQNPLKAHLILSRYYFIGKLLFEHSQRMAETKGWDEPSTQIRETYAEQIARFREYDPSLSPHWEDRHKVSSKVLAQVIDVQADVSESLYKDKAFLDAFADTEELRRGIDLENFFAAKRQEFDRANVATVEDALQKLAVNFPKQAQSTASNIKSSLRADSQAERVEYAFREAVYRLLHSELLNGTNEAWPSLTSTDLPHQDDQQVASLRKDIWVAVYRQEASRERE